MTAMNWIRWTRVTGMIPKASKRTGGKNSSMDGPWNSGPSDVSVAREVAVAKEVAALWPTEVAIRVAVWVNSAGSSFGAPARAG